MSRSDVSGISDEHESNGDSAGSSEHVCWTRCNTCYHSRLCGLHAAVSTVSTGQSQIVRDIPRCSGHSHVGCLR